MDQKGFTRADVRDKLTGRARYADDLQFPGMLYARAVHCPYPRARILGIDAGEALAVEDSPTGILSAKRAGLTILALRPRHGELLDQSAASSVIDQLNDVLNFL